MLMVIILHFNTQTQSIAVPGEEMTPTRVAGGLMESLCICAVNVYVLISGYFLCMADYKAERLIRLILEVLFYSVMIPIVFVVLQIPLYGQDIWTRFEYALPIEMEHYWFATSYVILYLLVPILNIAIRRMTRRQLKYTLFTLLIFFCLIKSFCPVQLTMDRFGYDFGWFICLYLTAAYIRLYGLSRIHTAKAGAFLYLGCSLLTFALYLVLQTINERTGELNYYATVPFHYNAVLCYLAAIGLLILFEKIHLPENGASQLIRRTASCTFGVYLIHSHVDVFEKWEIWMENITGHVWQNAPLRYIGQVLLASVLLFVMCALLDMVRGVFFDWCARYLRRTKLAACIRAVDDGFNRSDT